MDEKRKGVDRRTFIKTSLVAGAGLALTSSINNFSWGASSGDDVLAEASLLDGCTPHITFQTRENDG